MKKDQTRQEKSLEQEAKEKLGVNGANYINGKWEKWNEYNRGGFPSGFYSKNPAEEDEILGTFPLSREPEIKRAVISAKQAFKTWGDSTIISPIKRAEIIDNFVQLLKKDLDELAILVSKESGKPINEAKADVVEGIHMAQYAFGLAREPWGKALKSEISAKDAYELIKPKGVIAVITPWNFPVAIPLWSTMIPLVAGNTVVFKPSEETPLCGQRITEILEEAGMPPGVFNLIHGWGDVGEMLARHEDVDYILFTGSFEVAKKIRQICAEHDHKGCATEAGGKNGLIITKSANMNIAVNAAIIGAFKTSGQRCVSTSRVIVDKSRLKEFEEKFLEKVGQIKIGDPLDPDTFMGPMINKPTLNKVMMYNKMAAESPDVEILEPPQGKRIIFPVFGYYMQPFIYRLSDWEMSKTFAPCQEEVFGPHVAIIPYPEEDFETALEILNNTRYGLAGAIITENRNEARKFKERARVGLSYVNLPTIGAEVHLPFGGMKKSGNGHPSAAALLDAVTYKTAHTENFDEEIKMAQGLSAKI